MSDPKCGLLGSIWLDNDMRNGIVYQSDLPIKKAVGTVTITPRNPPGVGEYTYTGLWQESSQYEYGMVAKFNNQFIVAKSSVSAGTLPTNTAKWDKYTPLMVKLYVANVGYSGNFYKADSPNFMIIFQAFANSWDGTTMIPGVVISPTNRLFAVISAGDGISSDVAIGDVAIGFNGIEEYL